MFTFRSLNDFDTSESGTVTLVDAARVGKHKKGSDIVLIPQPSDDPKDPLNWPAWKKTLAFVSIGVFSGLGGWIIAGIGPAIVLLMEEFHTDLNETVNGVVNWGVLLLGLGNFFWVPLALYIGTRPVFVVTVFVTFATLIWAALSQSWGSLVAARVIGAFAASVGEALPAAIVRDLFFLHERGWWMGVYIWFFQCFLQLGGIATSFIISSNGWRWQSWTVAIVTGVDALAILFLFPETQFRRTVSAPDPVPPPATEKGASTSETTMSDLEPVPNKSYWKIGLGLWSGINPGIDKNTSFINLLLRPWPIVVYPAVLYSFLTFAISIGIVLAIADTAAVVFQSPPYNMSPAKQGTAQALALAIGITIGTFYGGTLADIYCQWHTRRNKGVFEPEVRLELMILPLLIVPGGALMYGFGIQHLTAWPLPMAGAGCVGFGLGSMPTITMTYAVDCYLPLAPEATLLIIGLKNIFGFGLGYGIVPWITADGYDGCLGALAGLQFVTIAFGLPLWYWGKQIRLYTLKWRVLMW